MKVMPFLSPETERLFQRSGGRLSGQTVVLAVERRFEFGTPGWLLMTLPYPDCLTVRVQRTEAAQRADLGPLERGVSWLVLLSASQLPYARLQIPSTYIRRCS